MANNSKIEWTDATWNPVTGCTPISEGCLNCYAKNLVRRFPQIHCDSDFGKIILHPNRLDQPRRWKKPREIFVCSMGDLFHDDVPQHFIHDVLEIIRLCPEHTFMLLTKRPENALKMEWKCMKYGQDYLHQHNIWLGVTAENQEQADKRIPILLEIPAAVRFVSIEPMIGPVDLSGYFGTAINGMAEVAHEYTYNAGINWVICGAETGAKARPMDYAWAVNLRDECLNAKVPFFFKKAGNRVPTPYGLDFKEFPKQRDTK